MCSGASQVLFPGDQAGPKADPSARVCGGPQGGMCQVTDQPQEGQKTCHQEVVLCP